MDPTIATIRARYLVRLSSPSRQGLVFEQYSRPKMTRLVAGPRFYFGLRIVAIASPTDVRVLTIICACVRVSAAVGVVHVGPKHHVEWDRPPKMG